VNMHTITIVPIMYRDADNWKDKGVIALVGQATEELRARLQRTLHDGENYLPTQIGHDHLGTTHENWPDEQVDHCWHELDVTEIEQIHGDPQQFGAAETFEEFVQRMEQARRDGWDVATACETLGIEN